MDESKQKMTRENRRALALKLFLEGKEYEEICAEIGINRIATITEWRQRYGWDELRKRRDNAAQRKIAAKAAHGIASRVGEHDEAGRGLRALALSGLANEARKGQGDIPGAPDSAIADRWSRILERAIRIERLSLGLPTVYRDDEEDTASPLAELSSDELLAIIQAARNGNGTKEELEKAEAAVGLAAPGEDGE